MPSPRITVRLDAPTATISPLLHGHFAEHLGGCVTPGLWVGPDSPIPNTRGFRNDVLDALRHLGVPVLRWPGGCFADDYHWRHGIGPRNQRPRTVNIWWGENIEDNAVGTHEFLDLCRLLSAEPYLAGNMGSGTPAEMRDWLEYCNFAGDSTLARQRRANGSPDPFAVRYWGVGNETWGCGGNMSPHDYAVEYKRLETYLRDFSGTKLFLVAVGPNGNCPKWTRGVFDTLAGFPRIHGFAAHYYTWNREGQFGTATDFTDADHYALLSKSLAMEQLIIDQRAILDEYDPSRRIGLIVDEWGAWHPPTPGTHPLHLHQQNTMRDALLAGLTLDTFHRHAEKLHMANLAQIVNVLQSLILTFDDRAILTPTYHVFDLHKHHRNAQGYVAEFDADPIPFTHPHHAGTLPRLAGSASVNNRTLTLTVTHTHLSEPLDATIDLPAARFADLRVTELAHRDVHAHNTPLAPSLVRPRTSHLALAGSSFPYTFSPASVTLFQASLA